MSKEKRDKLILTSLLICGILGALYTYVYMAQKDVLNGLNNAIKTRELEVSKLEILVKLGPIIQRNLNENRVKLAEMQKDMSAPGQEYYTFFRILKQLEEGQRFVNFVADMAPRPEPAEAGLLPKFPYKAAVLSFKPSGHYHEVGRFIAEFENSYPYLRIQNIRLMPEGRQIGGRANRGVDDAGGAPGPSEKLGGEIKAVNFVLPNPT